MTGVVHPAHGPGLITDVEQIDAAIAGFQRYYVIDIYGQNLYRACACAARIRSACVPSCPATG